MHHLSSINWKALLLQLAFLLFVVLGQWWLYGLMDIKVRAVHFDHLPLISNFLTFGKLKVLLLSALFGTSLLLTYFFPVRLQDVGRLARYLFLTVVLIQTYTIALMDYNHYYDTWFLVDRLSLIVLTGAVLYRPMLLPIYIFQLILLTGQLEYPHVIGYDHTHKSLVLPILICFWLFMVGNRLLNNRFDWQLYVIFLMSILGTWYFQAGIGKFNLNWFNDNNLYNLFAASFDAGWLSFLNKSTLIAVGDFLNEYHLLLQYGGIITELILPLLLLIDRRLTAVCLGFFIGFHVLVYILSGIFFWQWIVIEVIIGLILLKDRAYSQRFFTTTNLISYGFLLLLLPNFLNVIKLAWLDCGYINSYTFFLMQENGNQKRLDTSFFSPYDVGFAKNRFTYSLDEKFVSSTLGQCNDMAVLNIVNDWSKRNLAENMSLIEKYKTENGQYKYNENQTALFYHFLTEFTTNKLNYDPKWISVLDVPVHMQQGSNQQNLTLENVVEMRILYEEKVILPHLQFDVVRSDSAFLDLKNLK
ncbi:MAG: hypothetical protein AAGI23_13200 [Bacteroidota bacterium]